MCEGASPTHMEVTSSISTDKILKPSFKKSVQAFIDGLAAAKTINPTFEPENILDVSDENEVFASVRPTLLRGQDSNLEPTPYTYPSITAGVDYIIILSSFRRMGCEALPPFESTPLRDSLYTFPEIQSLARDCPKCRSSPNSPRLQSKFLWKAANRQGAALPLSYRGIFEQKNYT
jgi:hypothetical protein